MLPTLVPKWLHKSSSSRPLHGTELGSANAVFFDVVQSAVQKVATYTVHLLDRNGRMIERREVRAIRNYEVVETAKRLCRAAAQKCRGYEVWRGGRRVAREIFI